MGSKHIFQCHSKNMPTYLLPFYLERAMRYMNGFRPIFGRFRTRRIFYRLQNSQNPQLKIAKIMIFWNILKIDLKGFWYRFRVQNNSKTPQELISGHISSFRPISADVSKIEFLTQITIFAIFTYFDLSQYGRPYDRKCSKMGLETGNVLSEPSKHVRIHWMTFNDDLEAF